MNTSKICFYGKTLAMVSMLLVIGCEKTKKEIRQQVEEPKLMNTWEGTCAKSDLLGLSMKTFYKFGGTDFTEVHSFYSETDCKSEGHAADLTYKGDLTLKDETPKGREIDLRYDHVSIKPINKVGMDALNKIELCGKDDWALDKEIDLDGKTGGVKCPLREVPTGEVNLFAITGSALYLGQTGLTTGATRDADRPTEVDKKTSVQAVRSGIVEEAETCNGTM